MIGCRNIDSHFAISG